jgi:hypothetical protein
LIALFGTHCAQTGSQTSPNHASWQSLLVVQLVSNALALMLQSASASVLASGPLELTRPPQLTVTKERARTRRMWGFWCNGYTSHRYRTIR